MDSGVLPSEGRASALCSRLPTTPPFVLCFQCFQQFRGVCFLEIGSKNQPISRRRGGHASFQSQPLKHSQVWALPGATACMKPDLNEVAERRPQFPPNVYT